MVLDEIVDVPFVPDIWGDLQRRGEMPAAISRTDQFQGGEHLCLGWNPRNVAPSNKKAILGEWVRVLPTLKSVKMLSLDLRVNQELFDAACSLVDLKGLYLSANVLKDILAVACCDRLEYLHLGESPRLESLEPIRRLSRLSWLNVNSFSRSSDLSLLGEMTTLVGLAYNGVEGKGMTVDSLRPLGNLVNLRWLHMGALHVKDGALAPLSKLTDLSWLGIGNFFPKEEFATLAARSPQIRCSWLAPFARFHPSCFPCRKCRKESKVMTSGKPSYLLCPNCDREKLMHHVESFQAAARVP